MGDPSIRRSDKFDEFESALRTDVATGVQTVLEAARSHVLTTAQLDELQDILEQAYPNRFADRNAGVEDPGYGADFDLAAEVNDQIRAVRALRGMIIDPATGAVKKGTAARDVKELISSSSSLLGALMKFHEKIINQDRIRAIEHATIEAIKGLPEEHQEIFFITLETGLKDIQ